MSSLESDLIGEHLRLLDPNFLDVVAPRRPTYLYIKTIFDFLAALLLLVVLLPLMVLIALAIYLYSPGPVLFKQKRVGARLYHRDGVWFWRMTEFTCYKFRSMRCNADPSIHKEYIQAFINNDHNELSSIQGKDTKIRKLISDPRITGLGRILRKTSLDELPQLWNILRGDMSLVGPRPAIPYEVEMYKPWHRRRLEAKPGLTGLWQVSGRCEIDFDDSVRLDIEYIDNLSIWLDLKIFLKTPLVVLSFRGAH